MDGNFEEEELAESENVYENTASMEAEAEQPGDPSSASLALVGAPGQEFVSNMLSTKEPTTAIGEVKAKAALPERCTPLLQLLDQLGATRRESHLYVLQAARSLLLQRVARMPPDKLLPLLEASFAFIGIPDLRAIPLAVLNRLEPVPATFLKQLANDRELFGELPDSVQRQVWELDKKLLQQHSLRKMIEFVQEASTASKALDMAECLRQAAGEGEGPTSPRGRPAVLGSSGALGAKKGAGGGGLKREPEEALLPRGTVRSRCKPLQELVKMVGGSRLVYRGIVELCMVKFRDADAPPHIITLQDTGLCTLRSQLLMALHDQKATELCRTEQCHKLAWILDACLRDRILDERRLRELTSFFSLYDGVGRKEGKRGNKRPADHAFEGGDAESAGGLSHAPNNEPGRVLGEAAVVLRDPSTMRLLVTFAVRQLEEGVLKFKMPSDNKDLVMVTRLLQLASLARRQLQERRYHFPEASNLIIRSFFPLVSAFMADARISNLKGQQKEPPKSNQEAQNKDLVEMLRSEDVTHGFAMVYALDRLMTGDLYTAAVFLSSLAAFLADSASYKGHADWTAFGVTLTKQLHSMVSDGSLKPSGVVWSAAIDGIVMRLLDTEPQLHDQLLRVLSLVSSDLTDESLVGYLKRAAKETRKARRKMRKARAKGSTMDLAGAASSEAAMKEQAVLSPTRVAADAPELILSPSAYALAFSAEPKEDLCQGAYQSLASTLQARVNKDNCPELFNLLSSS